MPELYFLFLSETEVDFGGGQCDQAAALPCCSISHGLKNKCPLSVCSQYCFFFFLMLTGNILLIC